MEIVQIITQFLSAICLVILVFLYHRNHHELLSYRLVTKPYKPYIATYAVFMLFVLSVSLLQMSFGMDNIQEYVQRRI